MVNKDNHGVEITKLFFRSLYPVVEQKRGRLSAVGFKRHKNPSYRARQRKRNHDLLNPMCLTSENLLIIRSEIFFDDSPGFTKCYAFAHPDYAEGSMNDLKRSILLRKIFAPCLHGHGSVIGV